MSPILLLGLLVQIPGCQVGATDQVLDCVHGGRRFALVLPSAYTTDRSWPAVVLLHGDGRDYRTLIDNAVTRETLLGSGSVIVLPDGGRSWWSDQCAVLDLMDWLSPQLKLDRHRVACGGWSMGGYGSLRLVADHPERFTAWGAMIGLVDYPNSAYPKEASYPVPEMFGAPGDWPAANPMRLVERLRGKAIWFATADRAFDAAMNRSLRVRLEQKQIAHTFLTIPGSHDFAAVTALLPKLVDFLDNALRLKSGEEELH